MLHNAAMRPPTTRQAEGYDIVIWIDYDGDIVTKSYTSAGEDALRGLIPEYHKGQVAQILCDPKAFMDDMPKTLAIGIVNKRTKKLELMAGIPLH